MSLLTHQVFNFLSLMVTIYLSAGVIFALYLILKGFKDLDYHTQGTSLIFKLMMIPGILIFWPWLWSKLKFPDRDI